jgi:hypothetical protein
VKHKNIKVKKAIHRLKNTGRKVKEIKTCYKWNVVKKGKIAGKKVRKYKKKYDKVTAIRMLEARKGKKEVIEGGSMRMLDVKEKQKGRKERHSIAINGTKKEGSKNTRYKDSTVSTQASRRSTVNRPRVEMCTVPMFTKQDGRVQQCTVQKQLARSHVARNNWWNVTGFIKKCKCKRPVAVFNIVCCYILHRYPESYASLGVKKVEKPQSKSEQTGNAAGMIVVPICYSNVISIADQQYSNMDNEIVMDDEYNLQYPLLGQRKGKTSSYNLTKICNMFSGTKWYIEYSRYRE